MKIKEVNLGSFILKMLIDRGIEKAVLADYLGIHRQNVNRDVFSKNSLDTDLLRKICEFFDYNFFELFTNNNQNDYSKKEMKTTVTIEMGEQKAEKTFTISYGENKLKIE